MLLLLQLGTLQGCRYSMIQLANHNELLKAQFDVPLTGFSTSRPRDAVCLDAIDRELRRCLNIEEMREAGSFFTGQKLATLMASKFTKAISFDSIVVDPTCGAGNLLIECSRQLGVEQGLAKTLIRWGKCLRGYDIHETFVEAAKLRLIAEALSRGVEKDCTLKEGLSLLPHIKAADVMSLTSSDFKGVTHIVLNPPFCNWSSPQKSFWKKGKVNAAGVVFEQVLNLLPDDCQVSAILPEVLRAGSRYENWREFVSNSFLGNSQIYGKFSRKADVDVFLLSGRVHRGSQRTVEWFDRRSSHVALSEHFDVCVGSLVAYRDPEKGNIYPFVHPKVSPAWGTIKKCSEQRQFAGKVFRPPLIVIRRTSSPADKYRAVGTLVLGKEYVAVENHMIVLQPKDGKVGSCKLLLKNLKLSETNTFLNERIRLRHLTVGIVKQIPLTQGFTANNNIKKNEER